MIKLSEKVRLHCDDEPCEQSVRVSLVLLPNGGFGIDVPPHVAQQWQIFLDSKNPTRPYRARCPSCRSGKSAIAPSNLVVVRH